MVLNIDGPNAKVAVGNSNTNYMRFNHTTDSGGNALLEIKTALCSRRKTGSARFVGTISGSTLLGGTLGIGNYESGSDGTIRRKFNVTQDGAMFASNNGIYIR